MVSHTNLGLRFRLGRSVLVKGEGLSFGFGSVPGQTPFIFQNHICVCVSVCLCVCLFPLRNSDTEVTAGVSRHLRRCNSHMRKRHGCPAPNISEGLG